MGSFSGCAGPAVVGAGLAVIVMMLVVDLVPARGQEDRRSG
jgi:hypothetical protein